MTTRNHARALSILSILLTCSIASADPADAPKLETCADGPPDVLGASACVQAGNVVPFDARCLSFPEHQRREKVNERDATFYVDVTQGDVVVVSKPAFYALVSGGTAAVLAAIVLGGLAAAHKL